MPGPVGPVNGPGGTPEGVLIGVAGLFGLFIGSFLNVVVYRAPLGLSVSRPRSFCPTCDRQLEWWENIPLVSWLALRGRCHTCHQPISVRYPLVEAATALAFALVTWAWSGASPAAGYCILAATAIAVALIEYGGRRSPLSVAAIGTAIGEVVLVVAVVWTHHWGILVWSLVGAAVGTLAFALLRRRDPECRDPRFYGRSLLPLAGCWLGGLGGVHTAGRPGALPVLAGLVAWILGEVACLLIVWAGVRSHGGGAALDGSHDERAGAGEDDGNRDRGKRDGGRTWRPGPIPSTPLVTGIVVALVVSLTVAG
jgi:leader peptidase (prepilin peptidase)/N-methyltransferase